MALTHVTAVRNTLANDIKTAIDAGGAAAHIQITKTAGNYTGTNLLSTIALAFPSFGSAASGVITALGVPLQDPSAANTGTAVEFRIVDSTGAEVFHGTITATGGGGDMEMTSTAITAGDAIQVNSFTYTASP